MGWVLRYLLDYAAPVLKTLLIAALLVPFSRCGRDIPDEVQINQGEACDRASDCTSDDMCVVMDCLAGVCVQTSELRDDDNDGDPVLGCGQDCDDTNPNVSSLEIERCDGVDEDCDGRIDEDARGVEERISLAGSTFALFRESDSSYGLASVTGTAAFRTSYDQEGNPRTPVELFRLSRGSAFVSLRSFEWRESVLVVAQTDIGGLLYARREAGVWSNGAVNTLGPVAQFDAAYFDGRWSIVYQSLEGLTAAHYGLDGEPRELPELGQFGIASALTGLLIVAEGGVFFLNSSSVSPIDAEPLIPRGVVASGDGAVLALDSDQLIHRITQDGIDSVEPLPADTRTLIELNGAPAAILSDRVLLLNTSGAPLESFARRIVTGQFVDFVGDAGASATLTSSPWQLSFLVECE